MPVGDRWEKHVKARDAREALAAAKAERAAARAAAQPKRNGGVVSDRAGLQVQQRWSGPYTKEMEARHEVIANYGPLPWEKPGLAREERVIRFLEDLPITSGVLAGQKLKLRLFQKRYVRSVYRARKDGRRPVRTAILSMARKNGKSALAAGLALCHLCGPEAEPRGEVYSCANDRFQASKIFHEMLAMINAHEYLRARCNVVLFHRQITDIETSSFYTALSRDARTKMGLSPSFVIYDEFGQAADDDLYRAMDSAMGARQDPLLMVISTQAANDAAPLSRLIDYGLRVESGEVVDPTFHLTLFCAEADDNPWSPETWEKANPAIGDFRSLEDVQRLAVQARRMPGQENSFRNLILNQRVSAHTPFIKAETWKACDGKSGIPDGAQVDAALDLGATRDMTALVLIAQDMEGAFHVQPHFWLPGNIEERESEDRAPYGEWIRQGFLYPAGDVTDPRMIALKIAELNGRYRIRKLAFDRWRIGDLKRELDDIGCRVTLVPHGQGFRDMSPAVDTLARLIIQKRVRHGGHPVLTMNAVNAIETRDPAGGRKLDKAKSRGRIDGLVALAMAFSIAVIRAEPKIDVAALIG